MEKTIENYKNKLLEKIVRAIARLRALGAKDITLANGTKALYVPGNVRVRAFYDVKTYGMYIAANKRTHKHYIRNHKK